MVTIQVARASGHFPFRMQYEACGGSPTSRPQTGTALTFVSSAWASRTDAESTKMRELFKRGNDFTVQQLQKHFP